MCVYLCVSIYIYTHTLIHLELRRWQQWRLPRVVPCITVRTLLGRLVYKCIYIYIFIFVCIHVCVCMLVCLCAYVCDKS